MARSGDFPQTTRHVSDGYERCPSFPMQQQIREIAELLKTARRVLFITGAGVSAESGVPTFRGATGAFSHGLTEEGIPFEDVLSGPTFRRNPILSWKYFFRLERSFRGKEPNAAHRAIAALQSPGRDVRVLPEALSIGVAGGKDLAAHLGRNVIWRLLWILDRTCVSLSAWPYVRF